MTLIGCLALIILVAIFERASDLVISRSIRRMISKDTEESWTYGVLTAIRRPLTLFIFVYGISWTLSWHFGHLKTPDSDRTLHVALSRAADIGGTIAVVWFLYRFSAFVDKRFASAISGADSKLDQMLLPIFGLALRIVIMVTGVVIFIQNFTGIDISALLIHMGLIGLAVALAAKETLSNLIGAFIMLFDKPFQIGDEIVVDNYDGVVEQVGFRSARIRTLTGHAVSIPNHQMVNAAVRNITQRPYIRWTTSLGLSCFTPPEKVERAVAIVKEVFTDDVNIPEYRPPQVYFNNFNESTLNIAIYAWCYRPSWWDWQGNRGW